MKGNIVAEFSAGLAAGITVLSLELQFAIAGLITRAFSNILSTTSQSASIPLSAMSMLPLTFVVIDLLQNLAIGYSMSEGFTVGFLIGDLIMLVFLGNALWSALPEVVLGMIGAFVCAFIGLYLRATRNP